MDSPKLSWHERRSSLYIVESIWTCRALKATSRAVIADPCICISLVKSEKGVEVILAGAKTHPRLQALSSGYSCMTIRLKPGASLKNIQTSELTDATISFPADNEGRFEFGGKVFQFPDFDHVEEIIENLFAYGHIYFKQPQDKQMQPHRTYSRQIRRLTGISPHKLYQLQRIHQALRLLKNGATATDVVAELAFTDQAHFTHASKRFLGYTPKQFNELPQNP